MHVACHMDASYQELDWQMDERSRARAEASVAREIERASMVERI